MKKTLAAPLVALTLFALSCGSKNQTQENPTQTPGNEAQTEAPLGKKGTLLTSLVGEHNLTTIGGFTGANTMMDYALVNGKWEATGSSIDEGEREGYDIELSKEDLNKLQTMKVMVNPDLSISLMCNNETYFTFPFKEDEMVYSLSKSPKEYGSSVPENLQKNSTFINNTLYLYANDALSKINELDIAQVGADVAVLSYSEATKEFDLSLFFSECCDASNYTFKKTN